MLNKAKSAVKVLMELNTKVDSKAENVEGNIVVENVENKGTMKIEKYGFEIKNKKLITRGFDNVGNTVEMVEFPMEYIFWGGQIDIFISVEEKNFNQFLGIYRLSPEEFALTGEFAAKGYPEINPDVPGYLVAFATKEKNKINVFLFTTKEQVYENLKKKQIKSFRDKLFPGLATTIKEGAKVKEPACDVNSYGNIMPQDVEEKNIWPYIYSIIMPVYNVELFLREALDSIMEQKIDMFEPLVWGNAKTDAKKAKYRDIFEVILIDDGSTDGSAEICAEYAAKYRQISVIHKENGGVSSARNIGIKHATGKYITFPDADDKLSDNVLEKCYTFMENHYNDVDMVCYPIVFFDGEQGPHWLNFKFNKGERVIDIREDYDCQLTFVNSVVYKSEAVKEKIWMDENLELGEDGKFSSEILFRGKEAYGVVTDCTYYYRRRTNGEASAIQDQVNKPSYYRACVDDWLSWIVDESIRKYGCVTRYFQYFVASQIQWRIRAAWTMDKMLQTITESEVLEYKEKLLALMDNIDDNIIMCQKMLYPEHKKWLLEHKHKCNATKFYDGENVTYYVNGYKVGTSEPYVTIQFFDIKKSEIYIEGFVRSWEKNPEIYVCINNEFYPVSNTEQQVSGMAFDEVIYKGQSFTFTHPLPEDCTDMFVAIYEKIDGHMVRKKDVKYGKFMSLNRTLWSSYYFKNNWLLRLERGVFRMRCVCNPEYAKLPQAYERKFVNQVLDKYKNEKNFSYILDALDMRQEVIKLREVQTKPIWLISDSVDRADDNGKALFKYLSSQKIDDVDIYFVIKGGCESYEELKQYGKVVALQSREHLILHCLAEYIISSAGEEYVINPFENGTSELFKDCLASTKFVFLQHGVIKDDLSGWLRKYNKNIFGFVTSAQREHDSILDCEYYYKKENVWLTGLPRFDALQNAKKKRITIMPTWRRYLAEDMKTHTRKETIDFDEIKDTEYYEFYYGLLNNERLLGKAKELGYEIAFKIHPAMKVIGEHFIGNDNVEIYGIDKSYNEIYRDSSLIVTDYSSAIFDMVYLGKPIVYCWFDAEKFWAGEHTYTKGYFDYEKDGFGEVTYTLDELVDTLIEYMKNNCKMKPMYKKRAKEFFAFDDKKNCQRVYEKLIEGRQYF